MMYHHLSAMVNNFSIGDPVKWAGVNEDYPVDSYLAKNFLSENNFYTVKKVSEEELILEGIEIPFTYHIFKKVYN